MRPANDNGRFAKGDRVVLNSGGPEMIVSKSEEGTVTAVWRHPAGWRFSEFPEACLTSVAR